MECLTLTFSFNIYMDDYFSPFRLFDHLGVNNIRATGVLSKNRLRKCTIIGITVRGHLEQHPPSKNQCNFD